MNWACATSWKEASERVQPDYELLVKPIDAATGTHLWAKKRTEISQQDVFDLQDRITSSSAGAAVVAPTIEHAEIERAEAQAD